MSSTKAIPTRYSGWQFRSRLEARWAAFFDAIGWQWVYEPYDLDGWIPDFLVPGKRPLLVEVKPAASLAELEGLIEPAHEVPPQDVLLVGASPRLPAAGFGACFGDVDLYDGQYGGLLNQAFQGEGHGDGAVRTAAWDGAAWGRCRERPSHVCVYHPLGWHVAYPCGSYTGNDQDPWSEAATMSAWAAASNRTQWKKR